jgi:CRP-like cAMP-binding protein
MTTTLHVSHPQKSRMLMTHPIFSGLQARELDEIAPGCEVLRLEAGDRLFHQGDEGTDLFIVLTGRLRITCASPDGVLVVVGVIEDNGLVGEMSALDPSPRSATAIAAMQTTVVRVPGTQFIEMVRQGRPAARSLLRWIRGQVCRRLRVLDERIDAVFVDDGSSNGTDPVRNLWQATNGQEQQ